MSFRKAIFWAHLAVGLAAGMVIFVMSVTGLLLAFERQIVEWSESGHRLTSHSQSPRLPLEELLEKVNALHPGPSALIIKADPAAPIAVRYGRDEMRFFDPSTGQLLAVGSKSLHDFFHVITDIHRWLGAKGESRDSARAVTGACNTIFVLLIVSGLYLWWPRSWSWRSIRAISWFQSGLRGKARDFNWHNAIGLWCAPFLFVIAFTGVLISYPWATNLLYRATGSEPPPPRSRRDNAAERGGPTVWAGLDLLWPKVEAQAGIWKTIEIRLATKANAPVQFIVAGSHRGRPDLRSQLSLDPQSGEVIKSEIFAQQNLGRRLRTWARWAHTGEAGGWFGQLLAAIASTGAAFLVWTGFSLSWRRFFCRRPPVVEDGSSSISTTAPLDSASTRVPNHDGF